MAKYFEEEYILSKKEEAGYPDPDCRGLHIMSNAASTGRYLLLGVFSLFSLKAYYLSFEKDGLLFIQRGSTSNQLLVDKHFFIPNTEIQQIKAKKGVFQNKLVIYSMDRKKQVMRYPKTVLRVPWQKENAQWVNSQYGKK